VKVRGLYIAQRDFFIAAGQDPVQVFFHQPDKFLVRLQTLPAKSLDPLGQEPTGARLIPIAPEVNEAFFEQVRFRQLFRKG